MNIRPGSRGLCLNCGEGEVVFYLSDVLRNKGNVIGIDQNAENIFTAQQLAEIKKITNVSFYQSDNYQNGKVHQFDFIHCRLPLIMFIDPEELIKVNMDQLLKRGVILFEVIDFSGFNSIQNNYAFNRFLELYSALIKEYWENNPFCTNLNKELLQAGFQSVNHQFIPPIFLNGDYKHLPSLTLNCIKDELIVRKLSTDDEIEMLLAEMKSFEKDDHSLISLPGIHQIWATKT